MMHIDVKNWMKQRINRTFIYYQTSILYIEPKIKEWLVAMEHTSKLSPWPKDADVHPFQQQQADQGHKSIYSVHYQHFSSLPWLTHSHI